MPKLAFRLALLFLLAVCAATALTVPAEAGTPCSTHRPTAREEVDLRVVVRKNAGAQTSRLAIQYYCGHGDYAVVDLQSPFARQRHGVRDWSTIHCRREDPLGWQCDALVLHRGTKLRATVGESEQVIDVEFPLSMPLTTARDLVERALTMLRDPAAQPARCEVTDTHQIFANRSWNEARDELLSTSPFTVAVKMPNGPASATTQVWLAEWAVIEFPSACWIEILRLVVT